MLLMRAEGVGNILTLNYNRELVPWTLKYLDLVCNQ